ncbi:T3SS (YopN, CesT) and YbjN peptide-binding chaperone 1 [Solwaraspora sp. WMMB335]|uniref:T3SS (YopN, CesT) and YbjN peptide-binding chaperone 1 n=1 Tax=Solwaraspora sp. WMMB335 TaxID=3404118 RepID=UPI003B928EA7
MSGTDRGFLSRLVEALAARPAETTVSMPLPTGTRVAAALAARPVVGQGAMPLPALGRLTAALAARPLDDSVTSRPGLLGRDRGDDKLTGKVKLVVAEYLGTTVDQLRLDSDGNIGIRAGSAMIFVRAQEDTQLVDVFSPLLVGVQPSETLYRRLSDLTSSMLVSRLYCTGDTVWASIPVFGADFQSRHLVLAIRAMGELADDLDDQLRQEFGGSRFFGPESIGLDPVAVPDPTGYLREMAEAGDPPARQILVDLLADRGHVDELRMLAASGDWHAAARLAALLHRQGEHDEAERFLRLAADQGEPSARTELASLLARRGQLDEAITLLRAGLADDDWHGLGLLVNLLARQGRLDEVTVLLRERPGTGTG